MKHEGPQTAGWQPGPSLEGPLLERRPHSWPLVAREVVDGNLKTPIHTFRSRCFQVWQSCSLGGEVCLAGRGQRPGASPALSRGSRRGSPGLQRCTLDPQVHLLDLRLQKSHPGHFLAGTSGDDGVAEQDGPKAAIRGFCCSRSPPASPRPLQLCPAV